MESVGSYLKRERELRGIPLEEVAKVTKINIKTLRALEADDLSSLPPPVFVKGFIKAYSNYIGVDVNNAILMYENYLEGEKGSDKKLSEVKESSKLKISPLLLIITGLFLLSILVYLLILSYPDKTLKRSSRVDDKGETSISLPLEKIPPKKDTLDREALPPPHGIHTLTFSASQPTWIRVVIDGKDTKEVILQPGERIEWKAEEGFFVVIGNAGGVDVTFDDKQMGRTGKPGEVIRLSLP